MQSAFVERRAIAFDIGRGVIGGAGRAAQPNDWCARTKMSSAARIEGRAQAAPLARNTEARLAYGRKVCAADTKNRQSVETRRPLYRLTIAADASRKSKNARAPPCNGLKLPQRIR